MTQVRLAPEFLVVGMPRSGFSLLASVLNELKSHAAGRSSARHLVWRTLVDGLGGFVAQSVVREFERQGLGGRLLFNPNFRRLTGGPRWIDEGNPGLVCFRKYIGVRGLGDFTLVTRHPIEVLHADDVVHSHTGARSWVESNQFASRSRFVSIRNPYGILASAVFSLNALASEHLTLNYAPDSDEEEIRRSLAAYKLTDRLFYRSLISHMQREVQVFLPFARRFHPMRWEDLIQRPVETIRDIARAGSVEVDDPAAASIWQRLSNRNLTGAHRHNYRKGHGVVGGWRSWLVQAHLDDLAASGVPAALADYGYVAEERIDPERHTQFQNEVAAALACRKVIDTVADRDLFQFAFNKTNIDFSKFGFRQGKWRRHTRMERSSFADVSLEARVCEIAEASIEALDPLLQDIQACRDYQPRVVSDIFDRHAGRIAPLAGESYGTTRSACVAAAASAA